MGEVEIHQSIGITVSFFNHGEGKGNGNILDPMFTFRLGKVCYCSNSCKSREFLFDVQQIYPELLYQEYRVGLGSSMGGERSILEHLRR